MIVYIDGLIGAGKTTLIELLERSFPGAICLREPTKKWGELIESDGKTMTESFYANMEKYAYLFQMTAFLTRMDDIYKAAEADRDALIFVDRSIWADRYCFAENLFKMKKMTKLEIESYRLMFDFKLRGANIPASKSLFIYAKVDPQIAHSRIHKRGRADEATIPVEYLAALNDLHESMFSNITRPDQLLTLDMNRDIADRAVQDEIVHKILRFIGGHGARLTCGGARE